MFSVWELQGQLGGLNVESANARLRPLDEICPVLQADFALLRQCQCQADQQEMRP